MDLRARELDPTLGRFLSADTVQPNAPVSQGYNLYAYVANNPTSWVDPSGESAQSIVGYRLRPDARTTALTLGLLFAGVTATRTPSVGVVLLAFAVGVLVCYLDLAGPCWDQFVAGVGWVSDLGAATEAGVVSWTIDGLKNVVTSMGQTYPQMHGVTTLPDALQQPYDQSVGTTGQGDAESKRRQELARDPANGNKITDKSEHEADIALDLEKSGKLRGPVRRDPSGGADFIDGNGTYWDVKGFNSNNPGKPGNCTRAASMDAIRKAFRDNENVIVDTTNMKPHDIEDLRTAVQEQPGWSGRISGGREVNEGGAA